MAAKKQKPRREQPPKPPGKAWKKILPLLAVALLPWLLYFDTLNAAFVWDDHKLVQVNAARHSAADLAALWTSDFWRAGATASEYYRPLTSTTFVFDYIIHGQNPRGYHFTNILIYSAVCVLAFLVMRRLMSPGPALAAALLFAALPAHTENVCWISGRTDLVCAACMFGAMLAYLRGEESNRTWTRALSVALFLLSLFGKEMSITMAAIVAAHQYLKNGASAKSALRVLPFAVAAAAFWILHSLAATGQNLENIYLTPGVRVLAVIRNLGLGVWYSLFPGGFDYLITATREEAARHFPLPGARGMVPAASPLAVALAGTVAALIKKERMMAFALASGLIALLPVSGIIPIGVVFAVRFLLIPGFFFVLFAGLILDRFAGRRLSIAGMKPTITVLIMTPIIAAYGIISIAQTTAWRDDATLMQSVLAKNPDVSLAHFILGNALVEQKREQAAIVHYEKAISLRPAYGEAEYNLGILEQRRGRLVEAERHYRRALAINPAFAPARMALARLLARTGRGEEARRLMGEATPP